MKLYRKGKSIKDIAKERELAVTTIEGHLSGYVRTGELAVTDFVEPEKLEKIKSAMKQTEGIGFKPLKEMLGDSVSYGEIKMALAWSEWEAEQKISMQNED